MKCIVNKYNNTYHRTIRMKPVDVKSGNFIKYNVNPNDKGPKFKIGDHGRKSNKNCFANWPEEDFVIKKIKITVPWTYVISAFNG